MVHREKPSGYIPTLDGWRAIAILCVILDHDSERFPQVLQPALVIAGNRAVELFFTLSGFLICTRLLREEMSSGSISLRSFYLRRLTRIQPAALTYLCVISLLMLFGAIPRFWTGIAGAVLIIRNLWPSSRHINAWYTGHFWSLSVEEHFYLVFPTFLVLVRRYRLAVLIAALIGLRIWEVEVLNHPVLQHLGSNLQFRTDFHLIPIVLGCILAFLLLNQRACDVITKMLPLWVALCYLAFAAWRLVSFDRPYNDDLAAFLYPIVIAATVTHPRSLVSQVLELPAIRWIGRISYSLYLWQQLFFWRSAPTNWAPLAFVRQHAWSSYGGCLLCAVCSFYFIETPVIRIGHRIAKRINPKPLAA